MSCRFVIFKIVFSLLTGKQCKFAVVTTNSGQGTLAVHLEGPSKVAVVCSELDDGYEFTYTPMAPGSYMIIVKYCNVTIAGCPFKANITGIKFDFVHSFIHCFLCYYLNNFLPWTCRP